MLRLFIALPLPTEVETELDRLLTDLSKGGLFVVVQEIEGVRRQDVVHVPSFGLFNKVIGDRLFVFAADAWTGAPVPDLEVFLQVDTEPAIRGRTTSV